LLDRLERDGLADDTIVIFFSDHGAGLTGHKKIALARGTRVPMIVRDPGEVARICWAMMRTGLCAASRGRSAGLVRRHRARR
jgi:arylsulfatase A-like enzyme